MLLFFPPNSKESFYLRNIDLIINRLTFRLTGAHFDYYIVNIFKRDVCFALSTSWFLFKSHVGLLCK